MKRSLLLLALAVFALGFAAVHNTAQDSASAPPTTTGNSPGSIQMNRIAVLPPADTIASAARGFDFDHDGQREFILGRGISGLPNKPLDFYESPSDNSFHLVHVLDLGNDVTDAYFAQDAGDIDEDGLADLVVIGKDSRAGGVQDFGTQVYESDSPNTYPTELVWGVISRDGGWSHAQICDTDADGKQEIVVAEPVLAPGSELVIYENGGDDLYNETVSLSFPASIMQSFEITSDLDADGRDEILVGDLGQITAFESTGDDAYELIWGWVFDPFINVSFIIDAGDLDGDGKNEFLAGGLKPGGQLVAHVFEAVSDNDFQIVATIMQPYGDLNSHSLGAVADVDGDGSREIVLGSGNTLRVYGNAGGFGWSEIWSNAMGNLWSLGTGDHDADGKDELIVGEAFVDITSVWEIDPADAADMDSDNVVDVIDNCPVTPNSTQEDADNDTVGDVCDNCIYGPNPAQGPAIFGQDVVAENSQTFSWPVAADVVFVKGDLADVSTYVVDLVDSLALTNDLTDSSVPATGAGFYYLVRPDCVVGSWQTSLGAEPGRDLVLP